MRFAFASVPVPHDVTAVHTLHKTSLRALSHCPTQNCRSFTQLDCSTRVASPPLNYLFIHKSVFLTYMYYPPRFFFSNPPHGKPKAAAKALKKLLKKQKKKAAEAAEATAEATPTPGRPRTRSMDLAEATNGRPRTRSMDLAEGTVSPPAAKTEKKKKKKKRKAEDAEEVAAKKSKTADVAEPTEPAAEPAGAAPALTAAEFCSTHKIAIKSDDDGFECPVPMASFESTPFGGPIRGALKAAGYPAPTPTQAQ